MTTHPSRPISCAEVHDLLPDLFGNELDQQTAAELESHARTCERCHEQIEEWRAATGLIARAARQPLLALRAVEPIPASPSRARHVIRLFALAAAIAIAFGLGVWSGRRTTTPASSPQATLPASTNETPLLARYREVVGQSPKNSAFGVGLLSLARRH